MTERLFNINWTRELARTAKISAQASHYNLGLARHDVRHLADRLLEACDLLAEMANADKARRIMADMFPLTGLVNINKTKIGPGIDVIYDPKMEPNTVVFVHATEGSVLGRFVMEESK